MARHNLPVVVCTPENGTWYQVPGTLIPGPGSSLTGSGTRHVPGTEGIEIEIMHYSIVHQVPLR